MSSANRSLLAIGAFTDDATRRIEEAAEAVSIEVGFVSRCEEKMREKKIMMNRKRKVMKKKDE